MARTLGTKAGLLFDMEFMEFIKHLCRMQHVMQLFVVFLGFRPFQDVRSHMRMHIRKHSSKFILYVQVTRKFTAFLRHAA